MDATHTSMANQLEDARTLSSLPEEVIVKICNDIFPNDFRQQRKALANLWLTSKLFDCITRAILFKDVRLESNHVVQFAKNVDQVVAYTSACRITWIFLLLNSTLEI